MTAVESPLSFKQEARDNFTDRETSGSAKFDDCCDVIDTSKYRSGLLTSRMRPCCIPRLKLTRYYRMQLEGSDRHPDFIEIPGWLKPFLNHYHQMGCRAVRLCNDFRNLPDELLSAIRTACTTVIVLVMHRMLIAHDNASRDLMNQNELDKMEGEQWLYEGLGLSDDELDTYDQADFGVVRYFSP